MDRAFNGKVALVTGASSGIGRASAVAFACAGAKVVVADVNEGEGQETVEMIAKSAEVATFRRADVSKGADVEALVAEVVDEYGGLDFAINNAGTEGVFEFTADASEENWDRVMQVNLKSVWLCMKYEIPVIIKRGGGAIVNVSSAAGLCGVPACGAYVASKHGVVGLTRTAALEYGKDGIRVNAVCPGIIRTAMADRIESQCPGLFQPYVQEYPLQREGTAEEVADAILWLCSDAASFITGHALPIDGGYGAR